MKKAIILLWILSAAIGCSKDNDIENNKIVGEWKLEEAQIYGFEGGRSIDYSRENIIYNFRSDGILVITGGENAGYPNGEYEYALVKEPLGGPDDPEVLFLKIENSEWTYQNINGKMKLGMSYVDGPDLIFERK